MSLFYNQFQSQYFDKYDRSDGTQESAQAGNVALATSQL